ncbi:hypothetical protein ASE16_17860 [Leifsonia sp. Root227]|uniref:hypothetical protein n=1 Tax=unclassified Leifsonia TaxID=2663824 RepID=UPI0006F3AD71|nr:hypothetical protein [Leifsonia sp. Root227]KRC47196.1 hypothetical protein ASE16_17860 [Leifsonia sp. Root227]
MKLSSNIGAAQDAVSGFAVVDLDRNGQHVTLSSSTVASMSDGANVANKLLKSVLQLVSAVKGQADNVTALAAEIEERDDRDAGSWENTP